MSKLIGQFCDINDRQYLLEFDVADGNSGTAECTLCDDPFVTEMDTNAGNIYKPVKSQAATARILTDNLNDYKFELYSPQAQKVKVTLSSSSDIIWIGYVEPSLYDIGYTYENEELEVNCVDGLASLEYFKYKAISGDTKGIYSFRQLIEHCLKKCNCYHYAYLPQTMSISGVSMFECNLSEQVFYDKDDKDEKNMTFREALEAILQYMGFTAIAYGPDVYILDYDGIKNGNNTYTRVDLSGNTQDTNVTLSSAHTITADDYAETNARLSLDKIYQRASVEDEFYTVDSLMPDLYDEDKLKRIFPVNLNLPKRAIINPDKWCYYRVYVNEDHDFYSYTSGGTARDLEEAIQTVHYLGDLIPNDDIATNSTYRNINVLEHQYPAVRPPDIMRTDGQSAMLVKYHNYDAKAYKIEYLERGTVVQPYFTMDKGLVLCVNQPSGHWVSPGTPPPTRKLVEFTPNVKKPVTTGDHNIFLVIQGEFYYQDEYAIFGYDDSLERKEDKWKDEDAYVWCSMMYNGKWLSTYEIGGQQGVQWVDQETRFKLYLWREDHDHYINQAMKVKNNIPYYWDINAEGYAVRLPNGVPLAGDMKFAIYTPQSINNNYLTCSVWVRNFNLTLHAVGEESEKESTDTTKTLYVNEDNEIFQVIDDNNVDEFDTIQFKITTFDGKKIAFSCPTYVQPGVNVSRFVDKVYNANTQEQLRAEEHMIQRIVDQYSDKTRALDLNLSCNLPPYTLYTDDNLDKVFIAESIGCNYRYNSNTHKLIEKK